MLATKSSNNNSQPKSGEGSGLWLLKIISGLLIIVILGIHFWINHLVGEVDGLLSQEEVVRYYATHILIPIMEGIFVTFAVSHSLLGIRSIILDLKPSRTLLTVVNWLFIFIGIASVVYGYWLIGVIVNMGV
jgi:succinate dehydrogenase / fumarate reductase, membrane anchor subunit